MPAQPLRFSTDIKRLVVIDTQPPIEGFPPIEYVCNSAIEMMLLRSQLERAHMEVKVVSKRKACRLRQLVERKEAGQ